MAPKESVEQTADWQLKCGQIRERAGRIFKMEQWTDCSFVVGADAEKVEVKTHKLILAMASPVFEAMFYGTLKEGDDPIPIPDMQPAAFKALMEYIYTDDIEINTHNMACDLFYGAQKYMLPHLQTVCIEYLAGNLNPDIVCSIYEFAIVVGEDKLIRECEAVIQSKTTEVLKGGSFLEVELDTVVRIFSLNSMNVENELVLVRAAELYDKAHQKARTARMFEKAVENALAKSLDKFSHNFHINFDFNFGKQDQKKVSEINENLPSGSKSDTDLLKEKTTVANGNPEKPALCNVSLDETPNQPSQSSFHDSSPGKNYQSSSNSSKQEPLVSPIMPYPIRQYTRESSGKYYVKVPSYPERPILPALRKINFLTLTTQQIAEEKSLRSLLTTEELLAIVMNAASTKTFVPMPPGFSINRTQRRNCQFMTHSFFNSKHAQTHEDRNRRKHRIPPNTKLEL